MAEKQEYGGDEIKILEGLDPVRKRPGMYIGSTSASGLHHLVWEIVDNAVDEALAGFCTKILVTVHPDNSVTVVDNGRGIPVDEHPVKKIPTLEVVLTILHAGGKFDNSAYKVSGGLHGVGSSVVNALSKKMIARVKRDGNIYEMQFERGKTTQKMQIVGTSEDTGTSITFWPDDEIFETTVYDYDTLHDRLQEMAFLNRGLTIVLTDERERTPRVEEFCYQGGIIDFVKFLNQGEEVADGLKEPIYLSGENSAADAAKRAEVEVAACGKKAIGYFTYRGIDPVFSFAGYSADPEFSQAAELSGYVMSAYAEGKLDEVFIVYNHAKNAAEQTLVEQQVLPVKEESYADLLGLTAKQEDIFKSFRERDDSAIPGDIDFEPSTESVMSYMMNAYLNNAFYYAMLDSAAGEQGARRNAMKSATDNANEMVSTLERVYNTVRQGAITTEITEIVGGAAALED